MQMHDVPGEHGHEDEFENEEDHPFAKVDIVKLTSVGIDVGTATSQVIFSRLVLRRLGDQLSSRYVVAERHTHAAGHGVCDELLHTGGIGRHRNQPQLPATEAKQAIEQRD